MRIDVKDRNNMIIGWYDDAHNGSAYHIKNGYVGYYNDISDYTFDSRGSIYCSGDGRTSLIRDSERESK